MKTTRPYWLIASNIAAMIAFIISTVSPLGLVLVAGYALALLVRQKMPRDSANIWGLRLFIYAMGAVLGQSTRNPFYHYDARAFLTVGLILGGELILQTLRETPRGLRYDPAILLWSGLLFLIACNTLSPHIFVLAPIYVFTVVMAMNQNRTGAKSSALIAATRVGIVAIAVVIGAGLHSTLWLNRSQIMAAGAKLLSSGNYQSTGEDAEMGENPQLGSSFAQGASTARLMRITGNLSEQHLRGAAFDLYSSGTWGPALSSRTAQITPALPQETHENVGDSVNGATRTDIDATITMLRPSNQVLYAPLNVHALVPGAGATGFDWARYAGPLKTDGELLPVTFGILNSKKMLDGVELEQGPLCVAPDARQRQILLDVPPEIDPRVKELTAVATLDAPTQAEKIVAIVDYLQAHHGYSLNFARGSGDPVSEFLLSNKSAHCQYFAASAVMMMRIARIPARYVSGFYAHEAEKDGALIVRGRDAHAWAEAYVDGAGWVTVDATPVAGRADPAANPLPFGQKALENLIDWWGRVRAWFSRLTTLQILELMTVVLIIWGAERYRQSWSKTRRAARASTVPLELAPLARRFERALAKRGITLSPGVPWSESLPPDWEREARWVALYNQLRFARGDNGELRELARELDALEREKTRVE